MPEPLREYFALEAGEFLDQMDALLAGSERPDAVTFFRLARGVRGSAQLAGATAIASLAERLEDGARALRDGMLQWSPEVRARARATAADLRELVARHGEWSEADDARAAAAADRWADVRNGRRRSDQPGAGDELFAFVRREITGVVGEMDRVLAELRATPGAREPLRIVLRRMRPVRGVAGMEVLAPVLEVLEGIEDAAHEILGRGSPVTDEEIDLLSAAREALEAAGQSLEAGEAPGDSPALASFRERRDRADEAGVEGDVVPVSRLFPDTAGPHLVSSPMAPAPGADGSSSPEVEQFVRIEGTGFLDRAEGLLSTPAGPRRFVRTAREVAQLAASVRELALAYALPSLAAAADLAGSRLGAASTPDEARGALQALRYALPGAPPAPVTAEAAATPLLHPAEPVAETPVATVAEEEGVVPVETLLYSPAEALREARDLRARMEAMAGAGSPLAAALDELFGLVELALVRT